MPTDSGNVVRHSITRAPYVTLAIYISRNSTGNMTPFQVFSFWKFPWKYDLLWRQKLQETGISNRFPADSIVSGAFHPISRAEKSPRPLIFSHLPLFCDFFPGKESQHQHCRNRMLFGSSLGQFYMRRVRLTRGIPVISLEISREIQ